EEDMRLSRVLTLLLVIQKDISMLGTRSLLSPGNIHGPTAPTQGSEKYRAMLFSTPGTSSVSASVTMTMSWLAAARPMFSASTLPLLFVWVISLKFRALFAAIHFLAISPVPSGELPSINMISSRSRG